MIFPLPARLAIRRLPGIRPCAKEKRRAYNLLPKIVTATPGGMAAWLVKILHVTVKHTYSRIASDTPCGDRTTSHRSFGGMAVKPKYR